MSPVEALTDGVRSRLHIQPRAARTELAKTLGVARGNIVLVAGHSGRRKTVRAVGVTPTDALRKLGLAMA